MQKNILLIIESSETGGAEKVFVELVSLLDRTDYLVHVALLYKGWLYDKLVGLGVTPVLVPTHRGGFDFSLLAGIWRIVKDLRIDLIHSHLFTTNTYASICGGVIGVPVISTFHGTMDVAAGDRAKRLKWSSINRFSRCSVFVSCYLRDFFVERQLADASKARVVYNGIDLERFRNSPSKSAARAILGLPEKGLVVGCVGDLRPAKDYRTALRAAALLKEKIPSFSMVIVGSKTDLFLELEKLLDELGLGSQVRFIGFHSAIEKILPAFDIYLSSSTSEGFSLTVVEAMAAGLPVVATRSGGPEEIVHDGLTGRLVDAGSPGKIAAAIEALHRDPLAAATFAEAGRRLVESRFLVQAMVDGYQDIYAELLGMPRAEVHG